MDNVWITSDTHFCHSKPFLYEPRGFSSVEDMNEEIVKRWNEVVPKGWGAIVYHLGDMALSDTDTAMKINAVQCFRVHPVQNPGILPHTYAHTVRPATGCRI